MFRKILIANRGEIAGRIIRACKDLGVLSVAIYSEADEDSPHLELADETICVGPGPADLSYLNEDAILQAAVNTECQALHPGFGFLAENARFAQRCAQQNLTFIGPEPHHIRAMGDKSLARQTLAKAGLPVLPGSKETLRDLEHAQTLADQMGFPVLLKATAGGGGRGMRICRAANEVKNHFESASREAEKAFGNGALYLEKYIEGGRHIEFQVLADRYGHVIHLGERECSIQRNHQKLLEEAPAFGLDAQTRQSLGEKIRHAIATIGYCNAGTIEFLMDSENNLFFMEMNTRIQVEHPVTEMITGVDLVTWQIRIAAGEKLSLNQKDIALNGHAIECRINAENPADNFRPSPGEIKRFDPPSNVANGTFRLDTHVRQGTVIPPYYDSMIGKFIVHGKNRDETIEACRSMLDQFVIEGVPTTLDLHRAILQHPVFASGRYTCQFLSENPEVIGELS